MSIEYQRYQYKNAPLQEAIFEAKFSSESFDSTLSGRFFEKICEKFPQKNDLHFFSFHIGVLPPNSEPPIVQAPTMQAWNDSRERCLQIGRGIITANEMKYHDWTKFSESIKILLKGYFDCTQPLETQKVGFRCINRFLIPAETVTISDYFQIGLALPSDLQRLDGFGVNLFNKIMNKDIEVSVAIKFASDILKANEKGMAFVLDIDAFVSNDIEPKTEIILKAASQCHGVLGFVFESILQEKMRSLLGGVKK